MTYREAGLREVFDAVYRREFVESTLVGCHGGARFALLCPMRYGYWIPEMLFSIPLEHLFTLTW